MSQVDKSQVHDFVTGETVTEAMLDQNTEVLRAAHNDTDGRVTVLENAQAGAMTGIRSGTVFPTNPVPKAGDKFYRMDQETEYTYSNAGVWEAIPMQKNTYTKTETDGKFGALYGKSTGSYNTGSQILSSTAGVVELNSNIFSVKDASRFKFLKSGLYAVDVTVYRSDLLVNQHFEIGFCLNDDSNKMFSETIVNGQYGWSASSGPNMTMFQHKISYMQRANANDWIYFFISTDDGPRSYWWSYRIVRVSD